MENNKDTKVVEETTKSQEQNDDAIASAKARVKSHYEKKIADEYVAKTDYAELKQKYETLSREVKLPVLENQLLKAGMKKDAIADFLQLHPDMFEKTDAEITSVLEETKKSKGYMFDSAGFTASALPNNTDMKVEDKQKPLYTLDENGFVITNRKN